MTIPSSLFTRLPLNRVSSNVFRNLTRHRYHHHHHKSSYSIAKTASQICLLAAAIATATATATSQCNIDNKESRIIPVAFADNEDEKKDKEILLSRYAVSDVVDKVLPSVVNIRRISTPPTTTFRNIFSAEEHNQQQVCIGSGFFIDSKGLIITNAHVVRGSATVPPGPFLLQGESEDKGADDILQVTLSNGDTYVGRLVAMDEASDIALIKINTGCTATPPVQFGNSDAVRPGEFVVAVGSPLTLSNSVSFGIISTIRRELHQTSSPIPSNNNSQSPTPTSISTSPHNGLSYLQLDVAINQGSSGGPCVSLDGKIIGICSMKLAGDAEGIAFAIPIHYANLVTKELLKYGYVRRPYVGMTLISITPQLFDDLLHDTSYRPPRWLESDMRTTNCAQSLGLMVHHLNQDGPGYKAGLRPGDVVTQVDGVECRSTLEFLAALSFKVDVDCTLSVRRAATGKTDKIVIRPKVLLR